eukprot:m.87461 g.87461  ORF g.87461 m.87461 type:complete len:196 (-) comp26075_c0_seq1:116-703(-)
MAGKGATPHLGSTSQASSSTAPGSQPTTQGQTGNGQGASQSSTTAVTPSAQINLGFRSFQLNELARREQATAAAELVPRRKLDELVKQLDPHQALDAEVEELLVDMANDFVERVVTFSCQLAKHRNSDVLETKDVMLHLERNWNIRIPGFPRDDVKAPKPPKVVESHKQRLTAVQKDASNTARNASLAKRRKVDT